MGRWILLGLLVLAACGVPTPPTVSELEARAAKGDHKAVELLIERLGREADPQVRSDAYRSLLRVGAAYGPRLLVACRDVDAVLREHALALAANLKLSGVFDEAVHSLEDVDFPRRYVAAWVLGEIGDPRSIPILVRALGREEGDVAREVARSLVKLGRPVTPALLTALPSLGPEGKGYALRTLGDLRDPRSREVLERALAEQRTRADAAEALGKLGDRRAVPALLPHLADTQWRVRLEVCRALGLLGAAEAQEGLDRLRQSDPEPAVREWAARSLAMLLGTVVTFPNFRGEWVEPDNLYH